MSEQEILFSIIEFEGYVSIANELFEENYDLVDHPLVLSTAGTIPKFGKLESENSVFAQYKFHGNGCEFRFEDGALLDFNYHPSNWEYDGFSVYALRNFIKSTRNIIIDKYDLESNLLKLELENKIIRPDVTLPRFRLPPPND